MGWRFRKSINLGGGFRINLSKSGIGYSWGVKGYRITKTASGQTRKTYSIPDTGISYVENIPKRNNTQRINPQKQQINEPRTLTIGETTYYSSQNLDEMSKNDIVLKKIKDIHTLNYIANILCILIFSLPVGLLIKLIIAIWGRIDLEYEFDEYSKEKYNALNTVVTEMKKNNKMWRVNSSVQNANIKYSSGATNSITRNIINILKGTPWYIKSNIAIYYIADGRKKIYLTPDRIIILNGFKVVGCKYNNLDFNIFNSRYVEDGFVPKDAKVISYTWKYVNKNGGPDKRFKDNRQLPICDYGGLAVTSSDGINFRMQCSNIYLMAEATEHLNTFVDIVNKEIDSENTYYNFEEDLNDLNPADSDITENRTNTLADKEENNENKVESIEEEVIKNPETNSTNSPIATLKKVLRGLLLGVEWFFTFAFVVISLTNNMILAGILWLIFGVVSFYAYKKKNWIYRAINIVLFIFAFYILILLSPKEYDGTYISEKNVQVTLNKNKAELTLENGIKMDGSVTYRIKDNKMKIDVEIKENNQKYHYTFNRDEKTLYENEIKYNKVENN